MKYLLSLLEKLWRQDLLIVKIHYWCFSTDRQFYSCLFLFFYFEDGLADGYSLWKTLLSLQSRQVTSSFVFKSWTSWLVPINSVPLTSAKANSFVFLLSALHVSPKATSDCSKLTYLLMAALSVPKLHRCISITSVLTLTSIPPSTVVYGRALPWLHDKAAAGDSGVEVDVFFYFSSDG